VQITKKNHPSFVQAMRMSRLPPFIKSLGPLADLFGVWYLNQFSSKYDDLSSAASLEKVLSPCNFQES
jgi:hypothetical protein